MYGEIPREIGNFFLIGAVIYYRNSAFAATSATTTCDLLGQWSTMEYNGARVVVVVVMKIYP